MQSSDHISLSESVDGIGRDVTEPVIKCENIDLILYSSYCYQVIDPI